MRAKLSEKIAVRKSPVHGKGVFALKAIHNGEMIIDIEASIVSTSSEYTLQISERRHLFAGYIDNYINHSCAPNVRVKLYPSNPKRVSYIAIRRIPAGSELFWNYNTAEWKLKKRFACRCNPSCVEIVNGAKYSGRWPYATPFIRKLTYAN